MGLMSITGVPFRASNPRTLRTFFFRSNNFTKVKPMGFGRYWVRVPKIPTRGRSWRDLGWIFFIFLPASRTRLSQKRIMRWEYSSTPSNASSNLLSRMTSDITDSHPSLLIFRTELWTLPMASKEIFRKKTPRFFSDTADAANPNGSWVFLYFQIDS